MQLNIRIPDELVEDMDEHIDGIKYLSRSQIVAIAVSDWLKSKRPRDLPPGHIRIKKRPPAKQKKKMRKK